MANNKYISTKDAVRLTGLSTQEIYDLIHSGKLPARKAPKSGWRMTVQDLTTLGLIQEEMAHTSEVVKSEDGQKEDIITYIADDEHYTEVFKRMPSPRANGCRSVRIPASRCGSSSTARSSPSTRATSTKP